MKVMITSIFFFALLLAFAAAWSYDLSSGDESTCRRELQRHSLESCKNFLKYGPRSQQAMMMEEVESEEMTAPRECCNQLSRVSAECRCPIIRNMVQHIMREEEQGGRQQNDQQYRGERFGEMMMRGKFLPAMCNMEPHTCRMQQQQGYSY